MKHDLSTTPAWKLINGFLAKMNDRHDFALTVLRSMAMASPDVLNRNQIAKEHDLPHKDDPLWKRMARFFDHKDVKKANNMDIVWELRQIAGGYRGPQMWYASREAFYDNSP